MTIPEPLVNGTGGAMLWGVLSVLVNPCHFVTIPLLIGLIEKAGACESIRKAGWLSFVFSVGMGAVTLVAGVLLLLFGRGLGCSRWADVILALVTKGTLFLYPVALILAYVFAIGINLSFTGIPYVNMPAKNQTMFIGFYSSAANLAALLLLSMIVGG